MRYATSRTCSREIDFEVDNNNIVTSCEFIGGCMGNTQGGARNASHRVLHVLLLAAALTTSSRHLKASTAVIAVHHVRISLLRP